MGLARSLEPQHDRGLTQSGVTLGTFDYISPEQALEPRDADVRSDIYSLGCTFYHVLTGHPPVPEGTAAKKLHHHQHVKPPDPRQFVPDLPDEVAVILDRMMAKQVKDRYQTPEQLVHHLYLAARKLGAGAEVPEGVLAVEAALPQPPSGRPILLAALAAVAVVALVLFLDQSSAPRVGPAALPLAAGTNEKARELSGQQAVTPPAPPGDGGSATPVKPQQLDPKTPPVYQSDRPSASDLAEFLQKNRTAPEIIVELGGDLDLRSRDGREPDLVLGNNRVTIRPRGKARPTVRYDYHARTSQALQAPLTIESKESCVIEGIRFVLDQAGADVPMAALVVRNTRNTTVRGCEFIQANPNSGQQKRMASVLIESRAPVELGLAECCFLGFASLALPADGGARQVVFSGAASGGQDAITARGPAHVEATNCAFGPHAAAIRLEGPSADSEALVRLDHCSVLTANQSAVCDVADGVAARFEAIFSLFSHAGDPGMTGMAEGKGAVLVRQATGPGGVRFKGKQNRYHQLDALWVVGGEVQEPGDDLSQDEGSQELDGSPWKDPQPLRQLDQLAADELPAIKAAFQVNPQLSEVRLPAGLRKFGQLIGAEKVLTFSYLDRLPDLKDPPAGPPPRRELIVDASGRLDREKRIYPSLGHALFDAQRGDRISLRLDGEVKLDQLALDRDNAADLTIRAARGFRPVLTLGGAREVDAALFRVSYGKLQLEGLEIRLQPERDAYQSQAIVSFLGDGECVLRDCVLTLDRSGRNTALAAAIFVEPSRQMMKPEQPAARSRDQGPRFALENCLVRGQGDLVWSQGGQPAEVAVKNSLIALTGSLLNVEGSKFDVPAPAGVLAVQLEQVTTYLGGNLVRFRAVRDLKGVARVHCEPERCLFLPVSGDRALVHLEGPESEEPSLPFKLEWMAGTNAYGNFNTLLEHQAVGSGMMMPQPSDLRAWKKFSGEQDSHYGVKPLALPRADAPFSQMLPSAFRAPEKQKDFGADLALPRGKLEPRNPKDENPDFDSE
jgi:hypothetical protein